MNAASYVGSSTNSQSAPMMTHHVLDKPEGKVGDP